MGDGASIRATQRFPLGIGSRFHVTRGRAVPVKAFIGINPFSSPAVDELSYWSKEPSLADKKVELFGFSRKEAGGARTYSAPHPAVCIRREAWPGGRHRCPDCWSNDAFLRPGVEIVDRIDDPSAELRYTRPVPK